jgi:hypothetical protein
MNQISKSEIIIEKMNEEDNCEEIYTTRLRSVVRNINNKINYSAKNFKEDFNNNIDSHKSSSKNKLKNKKNQDVIQIKKINSDIKESEGFNEELHNTATCSKNFFEMDSEGEVYNFSSSKYQELEKNICSSETEATDLLKKDKSSKSSNSDVKEWSPKYKRRKRKYKKSKKKKKYDYNSSDDYDNFKNRKKNSMIKESCSKEVVLAKVKNSSHNSLCYENGVFEEDNYKIKENDEDTDKIIKNFEDNTKKGDRRIVNKEILYLEKLNILKKKLYLKLKIFCYGHEAMKLCTQNVLLIMKCMTMQNAKIIRKTILLRIIIYLSR